VSIYNKEPNLNSEPCQLIDHGPEIGNGYGKWLESVISARSHQIYVYKVTGLSERSALTMRNQLEWSELVSYSGVKLALASQGEPGKKPDWKLTLKIREPNSGADTKARNTLLSMNLEVELISVTCCGGWIVIQSSWRLKDQAQC